MSSDDKGKVAFSLGGNKKKKKTSNAVSAVDFGATTGTNNNNHSGESSSAAAHPQGPLVIPLSQQTQSLLDRIKQEENKNINNGHTENANSSSSNNNIKQEPDEAPSYSNNNNNNSSKEAEPFTIASGGNVNLAASVKQEQSSHQQHQQHQQYTDNSRDQLKRDLENLADDTTEEAYEQVPVSQFGAALLRGMGWKDEPQKSSSGGGDGGMPRPHRLGLGAIPKAEMSDQQLPSVLSGNKKRKGKKPTVQQLQQQEEFERQRQLQKQQDKQRTLQVGSIVYLQQKDPTAGGDDVVKKRAKVVQLQGVPGLNMVLVQLEDDERSSTSIKRGLLGDLVARPDLEKAPFVVPEPVKQRSNGNGNTNNDGKQDDIDRKRSRSGGDREASRSRERRDRDRSRSSSRERTSDRKQKSRDRDGDRKRSKDRDRDQDSDRDRDRDRKRRDRDKDRDRDRKRRREDDESDRGRKKERRSRDSSSKKSGSSSGKHRDETITTSSSSNPLWMIPNIRVRVVTEKLGKRYFRQKGVIIDVNRQQGATIKMDASGTVLEHVPERYLETALPKAGGQAIVLTGHNKWAKGRLLERDSKTSKGSIQVFEDMNIITLSLDDMAEWCGPLDDDLNE